MKIVATPTVQGQRSFERTTALVARALRLTPDVLMQSFAKSATSDLDAVLSLRRSAIDDTITWDDRAFLEWRYGITSSTSGGRNLWVLRRNHQILGMIGTEVMSIVTDEGVIEAVKIMDLAVDPRFAVHGIGGWMVMNLCQTQRVVVAIGHNASSRQLAERLFLRLSDRRTWSLPLDVRRFLGDKIRPAPVAAFLGQAATRFAEAARGLLLRSAPGVEVHRVDRFGPEFDVLLARGRRSGEAWVAKSANFLNWRLLDNPRGNCTAWAAYVEGVLVGYIAVIVRTRADGTRAAAIADWTVDPGCRRLVFRALCRQAVRFAQEARAEAIVTTAYHVPSERLLRSFGFVLRRREVEFFGLAGNDQGAIQKLAENKKWHATPANNDRD